MICLVERRITHGARGPRTPAGVLVTRMHNGRRRSLATASWDAAIPLSRRTLLLVRHADRAGTPPGLVPTPARPLPIGGDPAAGPCCARTIRVVRRQDRRGEPVSSSSSCSHHPRLRAMSRARAAIGRALPQEPEILARLSSLAISIAMPHLGSSRAGWPQPTMQAAAAAAPAPARFWSTVRVL